MQYMSDFGLNARRCAVLMIFFHQYNRTIVSKLFHLSRYVYCLIYIANWS
jgi:hypothetical protein